MKTATPDPLGPTLKDIALRNAAELAGCQPEWWPHGRGFVCGCDDLRHAGDQQCSLISWRRIKL